MEHPQVSANKKSLYYHWNSLVKYVKAYADNCRYSFYKMLSL